MSERVRATEDAQVIITVTLNRGDRQVALGTELRLGRRHRTVERRTLAGGKGVNVARLLKTLDMPVVATGLRGRAPPAHRSSSS